MLTSVGFLEMSAPEPFSISVVSITDGMSFQLAVDKTDTLDELRRMIGRHVKVKKEKVGRRKIEGWTKKSLSIPWCRQENRPIRRPGEKMVACRGV